MVFVFAVATGRGGTEVGRTRSSICVFVVAIVSPEMNAMFRTHAPDLRYGRQIDKHDIRCTAPYSTARETTTSVNEIHPINPDSG